MPSKNIKDCVQPLQDAWPKLVALYERAHPGCTLNLVCTHRTPEEQIGLFRECHTNEGTISDPKWLRDFDKPFTTNCDGFITLSAHNYYPSRAFDVVVIDESRKENWNDSRYMDLVGMCKQLGLVSGGSWTAKNKDWDHVEIPYYKSYMAPPAT